MTHAEYDARSDRSRAIDCPIPWCEGRWLDHGGDGGAPHDWVHHGNLVALDDIAALPESTAFTERVQFGSGAPGWTGHIHVGGGAFEEGLAVIAAALRRTADRLDEAASRSEQ